MQREQHRHGDSRGVDRWVGDRVAAAPFEEAVGKVAGFLG